MADSSQTSQPHWLDPVIEAYKKDVDRTLIRENLKLTPDQRIANLESLLRNAEAIREAMQRARAAKSSDAE